MQPGRLQGKEVLTGGDETRLTAPTIGQIQTGTLFKHGSHLRKPERDSTNMVYKTGYRHCPLSLACSDGRGFVSVSPDRRNQMAVTSVRPLLRLHASTSPRLHSFRDVSEAEISPGVVRPPPFRHALAILLPRTAGRNRIRDAFCDRVAWSVSRVTPAGRLLIISF